MSIYNDKRLATELLGKIESGASIHEISKWAHEIHLRYDENFTEKGRDFLMDLIAMDEGEEFYLSYNEMKLCAKSLIK